MDHFNAWWKGRTGTEAVLYTTVCLAFILWAAIDIGRALYQATH